MMKQNKLLMAFIFIFREKRTKLFTYVFGRTERNTSMNSQKNHANLNQNQSE